MLSSRWLASYVGQSEVPALTTVVFFFFFYVLFFLLYKVSSLRQPPDLENTITITTKQPPHSHPRLTLFPHFLFSPDPPQRFFFKKIPFFFPPDAISLKTSSTLFVIFFFGAGAGNVGCARVWGKQEYLQKAVNFFSHVSHNRKRELLKKKQF